MKSKLLTALFLCAICVLLAFSLTACKDDAVTTVARGEPGPAGADGAAWLMGETAPADTLGRDGDMYLCTTTFDIYVKASGTWSATGNIGGTPGRPGSTDALAFVIFDTDEAIGQCDPIVLAKGDAIGELPTPTKEYMIFDGWYHGTGYEATEVTADTVVTESMTLTAHWKPDLVMNFGDSIRAGEGSSLYSYYGGAAFGYIITGLTYDGQYYSESQAEDAGLINSLYTDVDDPYYGINAGYGYDISRLYTVIDIMRAGEYILHVEIRSMDGMMSIDRFDIPVTVEPPYFEDTIRVNEFRIGQSTQIVAKAGDTVTLYDLTRPSANIEAQVIAPADTVFTVTLNGTEITHTARYSGTNEWLLQLEGGSFDEAVTENKYVVTATSCYYGSAASELTVVLAQPPAVPTIIGNGYDRTLPRGNTFVQFVSFYSDDTALDYDLVFEVTDVSGEDASSAFGTPKVVQSASGDLYTYKIDMSSTSSVTYGQYTLTAKVMSKDAEPIELLRSQAVFYVVPTYWSGGDDNPYNMFLGITETLTYTLPVAVQGITLGGVELTPGQMKSVPCDYATVSATYSVTGSTTTLTMSYTGTKETGYGSEILFDSLIHMGDYSFTLHFLSTPVTDGEEMMLMEKIYLRSYIYMIETYFADELTVQGSPVKALYDMIMSIPEDATTEELLQLDMEQLFIAMEEYLESTDLPAGVDILEVLVAARQKVRAATPFSEEVLMAMDGSMMTMPFGLFDNELIYYLDDSMYSLFMIGMAEATHIADGGKVMADNIYMQVFYQMLDVPSSYAPAELAQLAQTVKAAKEAADAAIAADSADAEQLTAAYIDTVARAMEMLMALEGGGGAVRPPMIVL